MKLYHITKEANLCSIICSGLKVNTRRTGITCGGRDKVISRFKCLYGMQPIFLTNDYKFIIQTMIGNRWLLKKKAYLLEVDVDLNENNHSLGWFTNSDNGITHKEIRYYTNIPREKIKILKKLYV